MHPVCVPNHRLIQQIRHPFGLLLTLNVFPRIVLQKSCSLVKPNRNHHFRLIKKRCLLHRRRLFIPLPIMIQTLIKPLLRRSRDRCIYPRIRNHHSPNRENYLIHLPTKIDLIRLFRHSNSYMSEPIYCLKILLFLLVFLIGIKSNFQTKS